MTSPTLLPIDSRTPTPNDLQHDRRLSLEKQKTICLPVEKPGAGMTRTKTITMPHASQTSKRALPGMQVPMAVPYRRRVLRGSDMGASASTRAIKGFNANVKAEVIQKFFGSAPVAQANASHKGKNSRRNSSTSYNDGLEDAAALMELSKAEQDHFQINWFLPLNQMLTSMKLLGSFHKEFVADETGSDAAALRRSLRASGSGLAALMGTGPMDYEGVDS